MRVIVAAVRLVLSWIGIIVMVILGVIIFTPIALLPESIRFNLRLFFRLSSFWARVLLWLLGVRYNVVCDAPLPMYPAQPSVIVANHSSALDIFLLEAVVGGYPHIWMSKIAYASIPIFGFVLSRMHVVVSRASVRNAAAALQRLYRLAKGGARHVFIFPEGTRYSDGNIHRFRHGFARLSRQLSRPVRPIYIKNAHKVLAKGSIVANTTTSIQVVIGPAFVLDANESESDFVSRIHSWFVQKVE